MCNSYCRATLRTRQDTKNISYLTWDFPLETSYNGNEKKCRHQNGWEQTQYDTKFIAWIGFLQTSDPKRFVRAFWGFNCRFKFYRASGFSASGLFSQNKDFLNDTLHALDFVNCFFSAPIFSGSGDSDDFSFSSLFYSNGTPTTTCMS